MTSNIAASFRARSKPVVLAALFALPMWSCAKAEPRATTPHSASEGTAGEGTAGENTAAHGGGGEQNQTPQASAAPIQGGAASSASSAAVPSEQSTAAANASPHSLGAPPSGPEPVDGLGALAQTSQPGVKITGCLAEPAKEAVATRSGPPPSASPAAWRVSALGSTVVVTHTLDHACCLHGAATATVNGAVIVVEEQLTGEPCRCLCSSTIQTRVNAPPGDYDVQTYTVTNGTRKLANSGRVTVTGALRPSKR
jgi:hypothetical protein